MTGASMPSAVCYDSNIRHGRGDAARGLAFWLGLSTAPAFAIMALWSVLFGSQPDMLCLNAHDSSPMSGMTVMYLLMTVFHTAPWLNVIFDRRVAAASESI